MNDKDISKIIAIVYAVIYAIVYIRFIILKRHPIKRRNKNKKDKQ